MSELEKEVNNLIKIINSEFWKKDAERRREIYEKEFPEECKKLKNISQFDLIKKIIFIEPLSKEDITFEINAKEEIK